VRKGKRESRIGNRESGKFIVTVKYLGGVPVKFIEATAARKLFSLANQASEATVFKSPAAARAMMTEYRMDQEEFLVVPL